MNSGRYSARMIYWIIMSGAAIRSIAAIYTCVINPDGMVYIQQAKAIYHGDWQLLRSCMPFVSSYPFLIAAAYGVLPSWIDSARLISLVFGSLTLVPLYFLVRRFTDEWTACLSVLLYAFMPVLVGTSADLVRDPICWFFLVSGLYFFVRQLENDGTYLKRFSYLASSYILFMLAGWARPESLIVLVFSYFFALVYFFSSKQKKYLLLVASSLLLFVVPLAAGAMIFDPSFYTYYSEAAASKLPASFASYQNLRQQLEVLARSLDPEAQRSFLFKVKNLVWLVDLGVLMGNSVAGIFYPYILFFVLGFFGVTTRIKNDPRVVYLCILVVLGYGLLFLHVLQFWYFEHRFLYIIILPGSILGAFGIGQIIRFGHVKLGLRFSVVVILITVYILTFGLGKNIKKRDEDKLVFFEIAEYISELEKPHNALVPVLTHDSSSLKLVPFYLNLNLSRGFCPRYSIPAIKNEGDFFEYFMANDIKYFIWDEKNWSKTRIDIHSDRFLLIFRELKQWENEELGTIILFCRAQ